MSSIIFLVWPKVLTGSPYYVFIANRALSYAGAIILDTNGLSIMSFLFNAYAAKNAGALFLFCLLFC